MHTHTHTHFAPRYTTVKNIYYFEIATLLPFPTSPPAVCRLCAAAVTDKTHGTVFLVKWILNEDRENLYWLGTQTLITIMTSITNYTVLG
jgi:hypothetical protein